MKTDNLTLSLVELPRARGSVLEKSLTWVAPADLGTSSMAVPEGDELTLDVRLTSVDDGVLVQLDTEATLRGECVRCLDSVVEHHDICVSEVYFEPSAVERFIAEDEEGELSADDYSLIGEKDTIDLETLVRDSVVTLVEPLPLCSADCPGLCPDCGEKWLDLPEDHAHEVIDPRLAGLAALLDSGLLAHGGDSSDAGSGNAGTQTEG